MSWLSSGLHGIDSAIHKIPIIGSHIPSAAGLLGGVVGGGIGQLGGSALNHTLGSDIAKGAGNAAIAVPLVSALGGATSGAGGIAGAAGKLLGGGSGGLNIGNLVDAGLGTAGAINAANLQGKSNQYAENAMNTANSSYDARAPLRTAGIQGMLNPTPSVNLSGLQTISQRSNPFAKGGIQLGNTAPAPAPTAPSANQPGIKMPSQFATS